MKKEWIDLLRCPLCRESFSLKDEKTEEGLVAEGRLECGKHSFMIKDFIPRLVPESMTETQKETVKSFSSKWTWSDQMKEYGHTKAMEDMLHKWYLDRYGWQEKDFELFLSEQRYILDAGCGVGRDSKWFAKNCKGVVVSVDISEGIDVTRENLKELRNIFFVQADITRLPFKEELFSFISCDQVIHHTPNTEATFRHLVRYLQKGGCFSTYVYKIKGPIREFSEEYIRSRTTKMSPEECYEFSRRITLLGKAFSDLHATVDIPEDIPMLGIKKGKIDVQRFIYWNVFKCFWNDDFGMERSIMTNFDWYHPVDAHRHTPEQLKSWADECRLKILYFDECDAGLSIRAKK